MYKDLVGFEAEAMSKYKLKDLEGFHEKLCKFFKCIEVYVSSSKAALVQATKVRLFYLTAILSC